MYGEVIWLLMCCFYNVECISLWIWSNFIGIRFVFDYRVDCGKFKSYVVGLSEGSFLDILIFCSFFNIVIWF